MGVVYFFFAVIIFALLVYFVSIAVQLIRMERLIEDKVEILEDEIADVFGTHIPRTEKNKKTED